MSLRKETLYISETPVGWTVSRNDGTTESGPYFDREKAVACALAIAKGSHAQNVKVSRAIGQWSVEWLNAETSRD